ncbi:sporulation protein [Streptomyces sp. NPDC127066]|uniref:sporulation protein n=1 Tax=Streptomyces sp. NPDC127066 TaxID=3347125 RepID=UPI00364702C8
MIASSGASHKRLAHRINELARGHGAETHYTHTSVANWCERGMTPRWPVPRLLAQAVAEALGRPVSVAELGMSAPAAAQDTGLEFSRDRAEALRVATEYWSAVDRRDFLARSGFAIASFNTPVTRWLVKPAEEPQEHFGGRHVGAGDVEELRLAAREASRWDSRYGGGNWKSSSVTDCLYRRAVPLLHGSYTARVGQELLSATAELGRVAGWIAFDTERHALAQRHFIQSLRLAREAGDTQLGCYVLTTMAMQATQRGYLSEAVDMAQGAYERSEHSTAPRVLAFAKVIEAKALARARDKKAALAALDRARVLLDTAETSDRPDEDPQWIAFFTPARIAADAIEIYADLRMPRAVLTWEPRAAAIAPQHFSRCVGIRLAIVAQAHAQAGHIDESVRVGYQSLGILNRVESTRAKVYIHRLATDLSSQRREPDVRAFLHAVRGTDRPVPA